MREDPKDVEAKITAANRRISELHEQDDHEEAFKLAIQTVDFARMQLGDAHQLFILSLGNLAVAYKWLGQLNEAKRAYDQILHWHKLNQMEKSKSYAVTLNNLAELYVDFDDNAAAEPLYIRALRILESILPPFDTMLADPLSNLGQFYARTGRHSQAETLMRRALEIDKRTVGTNHSRYGMHLSSLAGVLHSLGRHADCMRLLREALPIIYGSMGRQHHQLAAALCRIANTYVSVGDFPEAERLYKEALDIQFAILGKTQRTAETFEMLALLYMKMGKKKEAQSAIMQAQEIWHDIGRPHSSVNSLLTLAMWHDSVGDLDSAESLMRQTIQIEESIFGENYPPLARTLNSLAQILKSKGDFREAEQLYNRALALQSAASGRDHPSRAIILHNLGMLYAALGDASQAVEFMKEAEAISERQIGQIFSMTSERQRLLYIEEVADRNSCLLSLISEHLPHRPDAVRTAFELVLRRKGLASEALASQQTAILQGRYPALEPKLREISKLKNSISQDTWSGPAAKGWREHEQQLAELLSRLEQLEMEVAQEVSEMDLNSVLDAVSTDAVASTLPEGSVLVEFAEYDRINFFFRPMQTQSARGPRHYLAFVLPAGKPEKLRMFDLGETWPIDLRIAKYRGWLSLEIIEEDAGNLRTRQTSGQIGDAGRNLGNDLRRMLFDPICDAIDKCKQLYLAPVGDITRLPFQALPLDEDSYITDAFNIGYFNAGRDVLRFRTPADGRGSVPVVIADPDFDTGLADAQPADPSFDPLSNDPNENSFRFKPLPGTRVEGERVGALLGVQPWMRTEAVKARLRRCRSPRILHIATHGFFIAGQGMEAGISHQTTVDRIPMFQGPGTDNPFVRSGLALAGANATLSGRAPIPEAENGLLTAEDISGLDLASTELVTLPDCDTGLGEPHTSEGVFGFRRSCLVAGARTLVMSLWKIPDISTAVLMVKFYENLRDGYSRCHALLAAQDYVRRVTIGELRKSWLTTEMIDKFAGGNGQAITELEREYVRMPDEHRPFAHPFFWGALISEGDPSRLEWAGKTEEERCRVPALDWRPMPHNSDSSHLGNAVYGSPNYPVLCAPESQNFFNLPDRVYPDIGLIVGPDSRSVAYGVQDNRGMHVEVNGHSFRSYEYVSGVQLADRVLAYAAFRGKHWFVVFNEQEHDAWDDIGRSSPAISLDSNRVAYSARRRNDWYAIIDGSIVGGPYEGFAPGGILFSPDSRRYAYAIKRGPSWHVVVDGKEGPGYPRILERSLTFSPDSRQLAFVASVNGRWHGNAFVGEGAAVVNGTAGRIWKIDEVARNNGLWGELYFSPDASRLAYSGIQNGRCFVAIDDKVYDKYDGLNPCRTSRADGKPLIYHSEKSGGIAFSADSRRVAYGAISGGKPFLIVIDGHGYERHFLHDAILNQPPLFSPDSQHIAYGIEGHLEQGVAIDGRVCWSHSGLPPVPWSFSSNSKLLAYIVWNGSANDMSLALNGRELHLNGSILVNSAIVWDDLDCLHFLVSDGQRIWIQNVGVDGERQPIAV